MKVIWKRPDGYHDASPSDYLVVEVCPHIRIWLHKSDQENYPFRVSGGWQDESASRKLNQLVNLIKKPTEEWVAFLTTLFNDSANESAQSFVQLEKNWLDELRRNLKGDTWELEIMEETLKEVKNRLDLAMPEFQKNAGQ